MDFATVPAAPPTEKNHRATSRPPPISAKVPYVVASRLSASAFCRGLEAALTMGLSNQLACLLKVEARRARIELARVAVTEVAKEIRFDRRPREEPRVHLGVVEARHRAAIEPQRAGG